MFQNLVIRVVGEGSEVSFWRAKWATHESLGKSFTRIFLNLEQKDNMVVYITERKKVAKASGSQPPSMILDRTEDK